jgi:aerobic C4-dicarboxylate transport protein
MNKLERGLLQIGGGPGGPTGYSFNLDGTNIYMTMAALFIAQATNTELTLMQELTILGVAMLTSKGAAASPAPASSRWQPRWPWCRIFRWPAWR